MTTLYIVYGVALFALGFASLIYPTDASKIPLGRHIRTLGAFGVTHSLVEWLHALQAAGAVDSFEIAPVRSILLAATFAFLLQFALGSLGVVGYLRFLPLGLAMACLVLGFTGTSHWPRMATAARYLLGLPGSALAAVAMFRLANRLATRPRKYAFRTRLLGASFLVYARSERPE